MMEFGPILISNRKLYQNSGCSTLTIPAGETQMNHLLCIQKVFYSNIKEFFEVSPQPFMLDGDSHFIVFRYLRVYVPGK